MKKIVKPLTAIKTISIGRRAMLARLLLTTFTPLVYAQNSQNSRNQPSLDEVDFTALSHNAWINTLAVRRWPAEDYTRLTLEFSDTVHFRHLLLSNPDRLVVDVDDVVLSQIIRNVEQTKIADDPYIKSIRVSAFTARTVRIVLDLKQSVRPQIFSAEPIGQYRHRFFIDLYPTIEHDPLTVLLQLQEEEGAEPHVRPPPFAKKTEPRPHATVPSPPTSMASPMVMKRQRLMIVLDPGHGGEDPGAVGSAGTYEKNVVLEIAQRTQKRLIALGMNCLLTRDRDFFIPLAQRVHKARRMKADGFLSIHADAFIRKEASGSSIYVVSDKSASSSAAQWLAKKENGADQMGGIFSQSSAGVRDLLIDLVQSKSREDSQRMADTILGEIAKINRLHKKAIEYAGFAVLKAPDFPSALIETAFISNPTEERRLKQPDYQESIAQAIARGIHFYGQS